MMHVVTNKGPRDQSKPTATHCGRSSAACQIGGEVDLSEPAVRTIQPEYMLRRGAALN
jgi:hypothetical protein